MVCCFAPECSHTNERESCRFFTFPIDKKILQKWIRNIRRADRQPTKSSRICSCHFVDGSKENGPTVFLRNEGKRFRWQSPQKSKRKNQKAILSTLEDQEDGNLPYEPLPSTSTLRPSTAIPGSSASAMAEAENYFLHKQLTEVKSLHQSQFNWEQILKDEKLIKFYTGFQNCNVAVYFLSLFKSLEINYYAGWNVVKIKREDQILMTLMKLRHNFKRIDLSCRFNCSTGTVSNILLTWIHIIHKIIFLTLMDTVPSQEKNVCCLPQCFQELSNCRMVLDCTEVFCDVPNNMNIQKATYSNYKHHTTLKGLIGVAPNGVVTFGSKLYPGSISDKDIVRESGVLDVFVSGDLVLADKGFLIADLLPSGVSLNIPPFLSTPQFTPSQVYKTRLLARARIHVERAIRRIKEYNILNRIPNYLFSQSSVVFQCCVALSNWQNPLIKEVTEFYNNSDQ